MLIDLLIIKRFLHGSIIIWHRTASWRHANKHHRGYPSLLGSPCVCASRRQTSSVWRHSGLLLAVGGRGEGVEKEKRDDIFVLIPSSLKISPQSVGEWQVNKMSTLNPRIDRGWCMNMGEGVYPTSFAIEGAVAIESARFYEFWFRGLFSWKQYNGSLNWSRKMLLIFHSTLFTP